MDENDFAPKLAGQEQRKQKLLEYLEAKGKLRPPNPKPYLRDNPIKGKKLAGTSVKSATSDEGKENQRLKLKCATEKPQPFAPRKPTTTRRPLQSACQSSAINNTVKQAKERCRSLAAASTHPRTAPQAKMCPHSSLPAQRANLTTVTTKKHPNLGPKCSLGLSESLEVRNSSSTARHAQTGLVTSTQTKLHPVTNGSATHPNTSFRTRTRTITAAPALAPRAHSNTTTQLKTCSNKIAPSARTPLVRAATAKPEPCKVTATTVRSSAPVPAIVAPTKPIVMAPSKSDSKCKLSSFIIKKNSSTLQKKATVGTGLHGPVLSRTGSKPETSSEQSVVTKFNLHLSGPQTKKMQCSVQPVNLDKKPPQVRASYRGASSKSAQVGTCSSVSVSQADGAGEGRQVKALQRAVHQAMAEMRRKGSQWPVTGAGTCWVEGESRGTDGVTAKQRLSAAQARTPSVLVPSGSLTSGVILAESGPHRDADRCSTVPYMGQIVPCTVRCTKQPLELADLKTPARVNGTGPGLIGTAPPQAKKKLTAAQEDRLRKLEEWRKAKGISYKRPPMPARQCVKKTPAIPQHYWTAMEEEEEAHSLVCTIDRSLDDCIKLLEEGCPSEQVMEVLSRVPMAKKFAKYWICQARLLERAGNSEVLPLFEEAVRVVLEPVDDLRAVVFDIMKKKEEALDAVANKDSQVEERPQETTGMDPVTPGATSAMIRGAKEGSSVVKYKITATPGGRRSQHHEPMKLDGQELRFFTPVRRSVRIERSAPRYPAALQEHDPCVASFRELLAEEEREGNTDLNQNSPLYIYRENEALKGQVHLQLL